MAAVGLWRLVFVVGRVEGGTHALMERVLVGEIDDIVVVGIVCVCVCVCAFFIIEK